MNYTCLLALSACGFNPKTASVEHLCSAYTAPLSPYKNDAEVRDELLRRGARSASYWRSRVRQKS